MIITRMLNNSLVISWRRCP